MIVDLTRYIEAQEQNYAGALSEIKAGQKTGHWMWFIFPQIEGLGHSDTSKYYAIKNMEEARAYLNHDILGSRLKEISGELLKLSTNNAREVFGSPDDLKLQSSMTLFAMANEKDDNIFEKVLAKFFEGKYDKNTVEILEEKMI